MKKPLQKVDLSRYRYIYKIYEDKTITNASNNKNKIYVSGVHSWHP